MEAHPEHGPDHGPVEVFRSRGRRPCEERALVLRAKGLPFLIVDQGNAWVLLAPRAAAEAALRELRLYEEENRDWPPREELPTSAAGVVPGAVLYAAVLVLCFLLSSRAAFAGDWYAAGRGEGAALRAGEPWRAVTALTLHTGVPHLLSNLLFGAFLGTLLTLSHGGGVGWLAILVAGALGYATNTLLLDAAHRSIGASTAVFGAVGALVGSEWRRRHLLRATRLRRFAPPLIGLLLLSYLGFEGERTDVSAHVTGFLWGMPLGVLLCHLPRTWAQSGRAQAAAGALALATLLACWALALGVG